MVWLVRVRRKGHPPLAQTFERQKDGEAWAARMEAAISEERAVPGRLARRHTLTEAITLVQGYLATAETLEYSAESGQTTGVVGAAVRAEAVSGHYPS